MTTPQFGMLFHFTHMDNLPLILDHDALLSDTDVSAQGLLSKEAGEPGIKERRRKKRVSCDPGGVVGDYVPFYFSACSPMMYKISQGSVTSFKGDHHDLVYLVTDVSTVLSLNLPFAISDRNAATAVAEFSNNIAVLGDLSSPNPSCDFIDWSVMNAKWWNNIPEYPDRKECRMAEFLIYERMPIKGLIKVAAHGEPMRARVELMFKEAGYTTPVECEPTWYDS